MGQATRRLRCPQCATRGQDTKGDNFVVFDDGGAFCFACGFSKPSSKKSKAATKPTNTIATIMPDYTVEAILGQLGIGPNVIKQYGVTLQQDNDTGELFVFFPIVDVNGHRSFGIRRYFDVKTGSLSREFRTTKGTKFTNPLFGWQLVTNKTRRLLVCEGISDALAAATRLSHVSDLAVVGMVSASFARRAAAFIVRHASNLTVIMAFDNDTAGCDAASEFGSYLRANVNSLKLKWLPIPNQHKDLRDWLLADPDLELDRHLEEAPPWLGSDIVGSSEITSSFMEYLDCLVNERFISFSFSPTLSNAVRLMPGKLVAVAGDAGKGKSTLVEQIVLEALADGHRVFMISAEMKPAEVALKLVRNARGVNYYDKQVIANLTNEEKEDLFQFTQALLKRLHMFARFGSCGVEEIEAKIHELVAADVAPNLIVIDHLLAIAKEGSTEELEHIAKSLKALAERHNVPIIVLCHVRKQIKSIRPTIYRPQLSDIYNSGGLARYADVVLGVALDPDKRITYVETIKLERMGGGYANVMLKLTNWSLQEVDEEPIKATTQLVANEDGDDDLM